MDRPLIIFILGPTSAGKSEVAIEVAERLDGEVVSVDSMQVYKGMGTVTRAPGPALRHMPQRREKPLPRSLSMGGRQKFRRSGEASSSEPFFASDTS